MLPLAHAIYSFFCYRLETHHFYLSFFLCHDHKPAICCVIVAGGQHKQLVSVFGTKAGVIDRRRLNLLYKLVKHCLVGEIGILLVSEHTDFTLPVQTAVKRRNHLIFSLLIKRIKMDDRVFLVIAFIRIFGKLPEHSLVFHVMPIY